jgi:hypothetical protein
VAVVAALLSFAVLLLGLLGPRRQPTQPGDGRTVASYGFDLSTCLVPEERIVASGMDRDGLPVLEDPETMSIQQVEQANEEGRGKFLLDGDRVIGVAIGGEARAYPQRLMRWHEIVNDTVGGIPVVVTYNPLCDAVVVAKRTVDSEVVEFGISGLLYNSNLLMYDRQEEDGVASLWSQLQARAITGPHAGDQRHLEILPAALCTWSEWRTNYPDSRVLAPLHRLKQAYKRDPYHSYFGSDVLRFPVDPLPAIGDLGLKDRVVVVNAGGDEAVFAVPRLASAVGQSSGSYDTVVGDVPIRIDFAVHPGVATVTRRDGLGPSPITRYAFWFAWYATHPKGPSPRKTSG